MNNLEAATQIINPEVATQINWEPILLAVTAAILLGSAIILFYAARLQKRNNETYEKLQNENNKTTKKNLLHQALLNVQREYSSAEMLFAVQKLWQIYEGAGKDEAKLVNHYEKQLAEARDKIGTAEVREKDVSAVVKASLHYQRRIVSQFYSHLAILHEQDIIPEHIIFDIWNPWDLDIINKIIFPLDSFLRRTTKPKAPELDKGTYRLMRFYRASEKYRNIEGKTVNQEGK